MNKTYSHSKKIKLANAITKLKRDDMINIAKIINENNDINFTENKNGLFLLFDNLNDDTYNKIENYLKVHKISNNSTSSEKKIHTPYCSESDTHEQEMKYTSKEKALLKKNEI